MTSATDFNITTEIKRIENKKTNYGVLGKWTKYYDWLTRATTTR